VVDESNETNNCLNNTFDCPPCLKPDLEIVNKSETLDGSAFTVTYRVENNGGGNAGASTTCIYVDGTQVATDPVGELAAGESHTGTAGPFNCPCGTDVTVTVCADNDNVVDESKIMWLMSPMRRTTASTTPSTARHASSQTSRSSINPRIGLIS
jgi:subtilase family serine protease